MSSPLECNEQVPPFRIKDGKLYCEKIDLNTILDGFELKPELALIADNGHSETHYQYDVPKTPVYIYSQASIRNNVQSYVEGMKEANLTGKIGYAIKANPNFHVLKTLKSFGVQMIIAVSGFEVLAGLKAGFTPDNILMNGNGKQAWEVKLAVENGVMLNVDSVFDAHQLVKIYQDIQCQKEVTVLLRIRPVNQHDQAVSLTVHEYINTADESKFGFEFSELDQVLEILRTTENIKIVGVHCHFGSCIDNPKVSEWVGETISTMTDQLIGKGISVKIVNVGGGIGIDYHEPLPGLDQFLSAQSRDVKLNYDNLVNDHGKSCKMPRIGEFMAALARTVPKDVEIILEPGRSLVGNAGILLCNVLGVKKTVGRQYLIVDGSMNEVIRPCLYGSYHRVIPTTINVAEKWDMYDVVGPICESADFLTKKAPMQANSKYVAVMHCGAYCNSMSMNYNMRPRVSEILVNGETWRYIKKRDTFEQLMNNYS